MLPHRGAGETKGLLWLATLLLLGSPPCVLLNSTAAETVRSDAAGEVLASSAFQETAVDWSADKDRLALGLRKAEAFRKQLLVADAVAVGHLIEAFRRDVSPPTGRPDLRNFSATAELFIRQLRAEQCVPSSPAFKPFTGRWYGEWDKKLVDHHWKEVIIEPLPGTLLRDLGLRSQVEAQYAWIGDGFGWNYLVRPKGASGSVILGYVHHVQAHHPEVLSGEFPLVGYYDGPGRIIWVTTEAVFFEEVLGARLETAGPTSWMQQRYAITGFNYGTTEGTAVTRGKAFQAIYSRRPDTRPPWVQFDSPSP